MLLLQDHVQAICEHWEIYPCTTAEEAGKAYKDSGRYGLKKKAEVKANKDQIQPNKSKSSKNEQSKQINQKHQNNQSQSKSVKKTLHILVYAKQSAGPYFHCQGFSRQWSCDCGEATPYQKTYAVPNYRPVP